MVEPEQADEQGLREAVLDQRVFRICSDDSTYGEAVSLRLGLFGQFQKGSSRKPEVLETI